MDALEIEDLMDLDRSKKEPTPQKENIRPIDLDEVKSEDEEGDDDLLIEPVEDDYNFGGPKDPFMTRDKVIHSTFEQRPNLNPMPQDEPSKETYADLDKTEETNP
jgi:hypothetical protein